MSVTVDYEEISHDHTVDEITPSHSCTKIKWSFVPSTLEFVIRFQREFTLSPLFKIKRTTQESVHLTPVKQYQSVYKNILEPPDPQKIHQTTGYDLVDALVSDHTVLSIIIRKLVIKLPFSAVIIRL